MSGPTAAEIASQISGLQTSYNTAVTADMPFSVWRNGQSITVSVAATSSEVQRLALDLLAADRDHGLPAGYSIQDSSDGSVVAISWDELKALLDSLRSRTWSWQERLQAATTACYGAADLASLQAIAL